MADEPEKPPTRRRAPAAADKPAAPLGGPCSRRRAKPRRRTGCCGCETRGAWRREAGSAAPPARRRRPRRPVRPIRRRPPTRRRRRSLRRCRRRFPVPSTRDQLLGRRLDDHRPARVACSRSRSTCATRPMRAFDFCSDVTATDWPPRAGALRRGATACIRRAIAIACA